MPTPNRQFNASGVARRIGNRFRMPSSLVCVAPLAQPVGATSTSFDRQLAGNLLIARFGHQRLVGDRIVRTKGDVGRPPPACSRRPEAQVMAQEPADPPMDVVLVGSYAPLSLRDLATRGFEQSQPRRGRPTAGHRGAASSALFR